MMSELGVIAAVPITALQQHERSNGVH